jgi:hypothetical protein
MDSYFPSIDGGSVDFAGENVGGIYLDAVLRGFFCGEKFVVVKWLILAGGFGILWCEVDGEFVVKCGGMRGKRGSETDSFVVARCGTGFWDLFFR